MGVLGGLGHGSPDPPDLEEVILLASAVMFDCATSVGTVSENDISPQLLRRIVVRRPCPSP